MTEKTMIKDAIIKVVEGKDLAACEMEGAFCEIMSGAAEPAQISAFITALRIKGETVDEITQAAKVMRKFATKIDVRGGVDIETDEPNDDKEAILDTCGTGGSIANTFNISTTVAFVVAGCGVKVAKHGNRAASSQCGSADVLEKLGVDLNLSPINVQDCIKKIGIGFMYAPLFHSAMKYALPVRKAIGIRTIFNILGPLANPADATSQILGVYDKGLTELMAMVLRNLGVDRAFVVCGLDGVDEVSVTGLTQISELKQKRIRTYKVAPEKFQLKRAKLDQIRGGTAEDNARILVSVLEGEKGPRRDVVLLNAAYALVAAKKTRDIISGLRLAENAIDSKQAIGKLYQLRSFTKM